MEIYICISILYVRIEIRQCTQPPDKPPMVWLIGPTYGLDSAFANIRVASPERRNVSIHR